MTSEITTSEAESIPSLITAKLPDRSPMVILEIDRIALPMVLTHDESIRVLVRKSFFFMLVSGKLEYDGTKYYVFLQVDY